MRGNFEYDKGSYPYAAQYVSAGVQNVRDMRTLEIVVPYKLPTPVAIAAALRLNTAHHGGHKVALRGMLDAPYYTAHLALEDSQDLLTATDVQATYAALKEA